MTLELYRRIFWKSALTCLAVWGLTLQPLPIQAGELLVISHQNDVNKKVTVYSPDGSQLLGFEPEGNFEENVPTWIVASEDSMRIFVAATVVGHDHDEKGVPEGEGQIEVFDYSDYLSGSVTHVGSVQTGRHPFHMYIAPDGRAAVGNDEDGSVSLIDPTTLDVETIEAGFEHVTVAFVGDASDFDLFVGRFLGDENPGAVDIANSITGATRTRVEPLLPNPHSAVYSPISQRVYFACIGGLEAIGTAGAEMDLHVETIALPEGAEAELKISPDGRWIFGNIIPGEHDHEKGVEEEEEPLVFAYDVVSGATFTVESVMAADIALSPDGRWIIAGSFETHEGEDPAVHIIDADPGSPDFLTVVHEIDLGPGTGEPTLAGFSGAKFSATGKVAYVTLTQRDEILIVDMSDFSTHTIAVEPAPWFLQVVNVPIPSSVDNWELYSR